MSKNSKLSRSCERFERGRLYTPAGAAEAGQGDVVKKRTPPSRSRSGSESTRGKADQMVRGTVNLPHGHRKTAVSRLFAVGD